MQLKLYITLGWLLNGLWGVRVRAVGAKMIGPKSRVGSYSVHGTIGVLLKYPTTIGFQWGYLKNDPYHRALLLVGPKPSRLEVGTPTC